jgi:CDGSH-type Zn-finger protein
MNSDKDEKTTVQPTENGPYLVRNLKRFENSKGERLETKPAMMLCRCGGSNNKPHCDGTHAKTGFTSGKLGGPEDRRDSYAGRKITIHDNRSICAHSAFCTDGLPHVFKLGKEPWIDPDAADAAEIIRTIEKCPSGALSYSIDGVEHRDQDREPMIYVSHNGPHYVMGWIEIKGEQRAQDVSLEHCTLCRCGGSKNKPFCDGTHWYNKFNDDKN